MAGRSEPSYSRVVIRTLCRPGTRRGCGREGCGKGWGNQHAGYNIGLYRRPGSVTRGEMWGAWHRMAQLTCD